MYELGARSRSGRPISRVATADRPLQARAAPATARRIHTVRARPTLHLKWKAEDRVAVHCTRSAALGNYLRQLPSALIASMLLEAALVLECDVEMHDAGHPVHISRHMSRYFAGPHIDLTGNQTPPFSGTSTVVCCGTCWHPRRSCTNWYRQA